MIVVGSVKLVGLFGGEKLLCGGRWEIENLEKNVAKILWLLGLGIKTI